MKKIWLSIASVLSVCALGAGTAIAVAENANPNIQDAQANFGSITQLLTNDADCTFTAGVDAPKESEKACSGVEVYASSAKARFSYNGIVNLQDKENFIGFMFTPQTMGNNETDSITITLTDVYDENNFITILVYPGTIVGYPSTGYLRFNHNNVFPDDGFGIDYANCSDVPEYQADVASGKIKDYGGTYYMYFPSDAPDYAFKVHDYGTPMATSFPGKMGSRRYTPTYLYYDPEDLAIYGNSKHSNWPDRYDKVFDFDNPYIVGTDTFAGFTTNEVYISVDVVASAAGSHILLTEFGGVDMSQENIPVSAPSLGINYDGYDENALPYGVAGEKASYPIFDSLAYTTQDGEFTVDEIYVLRGTEYIPVINGRFATKESGVYTVMYKAKSASGYTATRQIQVTVKANYDEDVNYEISGRIPAEVYFGTDKVYLYDGVASGGSGRLTVEKTLTAAGKEIAIQKDGNLAYFVPELINGQTTVYELTYFVTDISGIAYEFTKEITVKASEKPVFEAPYVPEAVRVGYPTEFAVPSAVYYQNGTKVSVPVNVRVNGTVVEKGIYTPTTAGEFTLEYVAYHPEYPTDETKAHIQTYKVKALPLLNGENDVFFSSYFVTENFTLAEATTNNLTYKVSSIGTSELKYANALAASTLSFETGVNGNNYFKSIKFIVSDSVDANLKVEFELRNVTGLSVLYINGVRQSQTSGSFNTTELTNRLSLTFNNYDFKVTDGFNDLVGQVQYDVNGRTFNGFTSGAVYVTIQTEAVSENATLYLYTINGQAFNKGQADRRSPDIVFENNMPMNMYYNIGAQVLVPAAKAYDVFSGVENLSVTVTFGMTTLYTGDAKEDYTFIAAEYGSYIIAYKATDTNGRSVTKKISVIVGDKETPEITGEYTIATQYKVGEKITLPEITAKDNYTENVDSFYVIVTPSGDWKILDENTYIFNKEGVYFVRLCAMDKAMNISYKEYRVKVSSK